MKINPNKLFYGICGDNNCMSNKYQDKYRISSARLFNWDYRWDAAYFVTICTRNREAFFGNIREGNMILSDAGMVADQCWLAIPDHFNNVRLDAHVVMPNHVHGIIVIDNIVANNNIQADKTPFGSTVETLPVETLHCNVSTTEPTESADPRPKNEFMASISPKPGSLTTIIRSYKSAVSKQAHSLIKYFEWQTLFHHHIICTEDEYYRIQQYIINNPAMWKDDKFYFQKNP